MKKAWEVEDVENCVMRQIQESPNFDVKGTKRELDHENKCASTI